MKARVQGDGRSTRCIRPTACVQRTLYFRFEFFGHVQQTFGINRLTRSLIFPILHHYSHNQPQAEMPAVRRDNQEQGSGAGRKYRHNPIPEVERSEPVLFA